ncbi:hypothetical protein QVD17_26178 [Tagetes erecta]|uniref:Ubiquitin-like protease family profile domain-containing protein n=1 Tax=Tagetes erecta TaxID=13708 RepID=A0AAD8K9N3_TARER|nr:hypothetical protein QVD17_26178 [Tagetes erecta]
MENTMKSKLLSKEVELLQMPWRTQSNFIDCGIFAMRHMETYYGTSLKDWNCGLLKESEKQKLQLTDLRYKYLTKILLSDINILRDKVTSKVKEYAALDQIEREMMKLKARERIKERMKYLID